MTSVYLLLILGFYLKLLYSRVGSFWWKLPFLRGWHVNVSLCLRHVVDHADCTTLSFGWVHDKCSNSNQTIILTVRAASHPGLCRFALCWHIVKQSEVHVVLLLQQSTTLQQHYASHSCIMVFPKMCWMSGLNRFLIIFFCNSFPRYVLAEIKP